LSNHPRKQSIILGGHSPPTSSMPALLVDTTDNTERVQTCLLFEKSFPNGGQENSIEIERQKRDCTYRQRADP
jgi:hypothetical protein